MQLADELRSVFKGARAMRSTLKVLLSIAIFGLVPLHTQLTAGNRNDMTLFPPLDVLCAGTLMLFDKGFAAYDRLRQIRAAGHHYLCPMRLNGNAIIVRAHRAPAYVHKALRRQPEGVWLRDLLAADKRIGKAWDLDVVLWSKKRARSEEEVPSRLVIVPGPKQVQRPYLTNLERVAWPPQALAELSSPLAGRTRFQGIEAAPESRKCPEQGPERRTSLRLGFTH